MAQLVLISSYPKSGNSWMRALLTNYLHDGSEPSTINRLEGRLIASSRHLFDEVVGIEASDLTPAEIASYRPDVYRLLAAEAPGFVFMKVHDGFTPQHGGSTLFPADLAIKTIYLVRNPLDVAVSQAAWAGISLSESVERLCSWRVLASSAWQLSDQLEQVLPPWGEHVRGWVDDTVHGAHVVRYEDLLQAPQTAFEGALRSIGLDVDDARASKAIAFSRFERLREQEQASGFAEHRREWGAFFRRGVSGEGRRELEADQIKRLIHVHGPTMRRFGYLDAEGALTC